MIRGQLPSKVANTPPRPRRIIDQNIQSPAPRRGIDKGLALRRIPTSTAKAVTRSPYFCRNVVGERYVYDDVSAVRQQPFGDGATDVRRSSGDNSP